MKHLCTWIIEQPEEKMALESPSNHLGSTAPRNPCDRVSGEVRQDVRAKSEASPRIWWNWCPFKGLKWQCFLSWPFDAACGGGLLGSGVNLSTLELFFFCSQSLGGYAHSSLTNSFSIKFLIPFSLFFLSPFFHLSYLPWVHLFFKTPCRLMVLQRICWFEHMYCEKEEKNSPWHPEAGLALTVQPRYSPIRHEHRILSSDKVSLRSW